MRVSGVCVCVCVCMCVCEKGRGESECGSGEKNAPRAYTTDVFLGTDTSTCFL